MKIERNAVNFTPSVSQFYKSAFRMLRKESGIRAVRISNKNIRGKAECQYKFRGHTPLGL
jgi:hypothetical protein